MSTHTYNVGERLYERAMKKIGPGSIAPTIREWIVLSVVNDLANLDENKKPIQVVTLRAFTDDDEIYLAAPAWALDIQCSDGAWSRADPATAPTTKTKLKSRKSRRREEFSRRS